jgi:hypothetical protein
MAVRLSGLGSAALAVALSGCMSLLQASTSGPTVDAGDLPRQGSVDGDMAAADFDFEDAVAPSPSQPPQPPDKLPPPPKPKPLAAARPAPGITFEQLVGLSLEEARSLLGQPNLQTERPPAKVLAYHGKTCTLSVFFYLDLKTDEYRSLAYEVKGNDQSEPAKQRCLSEILADGSV